MNSRQKIVPFIFNFLTVWLTISSFPEKSFSQKIVIPYTIDHVRNQEKAKNWAATKYASWKKTLSTNDKRSLTKLLDPVDNAERKNLHHINHQLKVNGGDLSARPIDTAEENKILTDHIERINRILNRKEGKLDQPLIVYKNETLKEVIHTKDQYFRNPDHTLDEQKVKQLKKDFSAGLHSEFRIYDLFDDPNQDEMIKWRIELPAGTPTGLITEDKIVIDKDSAFNVNEIKIIAQKGKQLIRIETKLVPKENVKKEINQLTNQLQQDFNARLNLPLDKKFLDFRLTGSASHFIAKKLSRVINKFITNINDTITTKTLLFMLEKAGYVLFTDREIYTLPEIYAPLAITLKEVIDTMNVYGFYDIDGNRIITVNISHNFNRRAKLDPEILFHEFGHALDNYGAIILKLPANEISVSPQFQAIFAKEGKNLTKYGSTNSSEFFAEAFWMMHSVKNKNTVKEKAPLVYDFILQILEVIADHEPQSSAS